VRVILPDNVLFEAGRAGEGIRKQLRLNFLGHDIGQEETIFEPSWLGDDFEAVPMTTTGLFLGAGGFL